MQIAHRLFPHLPHDSPLCKTAACIPIVGIAVQSLCLRSLEQSSAAIDKDKVREEYEKLSLARWAVTIVVIAAGIFIWMVS